MTSMCVDSSQSWLAVGTDNGVHICWDLRFRLPVATLTHPAESRVLRLLCHPTHPSSFISAVQNNNEVSVWDWENQSRSLALWASPMPPLSVTKGSSNHNVYGCFAGSRMGDCPFLLTGGSDLRLRYWDLVHPAQSGLVSAGAYDPIKYQDLSYEYILINYFTLFSLFIYFTIYSQQFATCRRCGGDPRIGIYCGQRARTQLGSDQVFPSSRHHHDGLHSSRGSRGRDKRHHHGTRIPVLRRFRLERWRRQSMEMKIMASISLFVFFFC